MRADLLLTSYHTGIYYYFLFPSDNVPAWFSTEITHNFPERRKNLGNKMKPMRTKSTSSLLCQLSALSAPFAALAISFPLRSILKP